MRIRVTHLIAYELEGASGGARDGVGQASPGGPDGREPRFFLPGRLPCGACPLCRRGLAAACLAALETLPYDLEGAEPAWLELPDRFLTPLDEPPDVEPLPSDAAVSAGLVALGIQAAAAANLTPGDVAIWIGGGPVATVGAQLTATQGARTFFVGEEKPELVDLPSLTICASAPTALNVLDAESEPAAAGHQRSVRRVFATRSDPATLQSAALVVDAGASLVLLGRGSVRLPADLPLPPEARLIRVSGYHPDLIPEALAVLRRGEVRISRN